MFNNMKKMLGILLVLLFAMSLVSGCATPDAADTNGEQTDPETSDEIGTVDIGVIVSLSGVGAGMGQIFRDHILVGISEVNKSGGVMIDGQRYLLNALVRDDESTPDVASRRLRELNAEGVELFMGGTMAHLLFALGEAAGATDSMLIGLCMAPELFFEEGKSPYTTSIIGSTEHVGAVGAEWVVNEFQPQKIVFFLPDYAYGQDSFVGSSGHLDANYPDIEYEVIWSPVGAADLTPYIISVRDANPDVIIMGHWGADAINALKQSEELGLRDTAPIYFQHMLSVFATAVEPASVAGMPFAAWWHHDLSAFSDADTVAAAQAFTDKYFAATGTYPDGYGSGAYQGVFEIARGIELSNSIKGADVFQAAIIDNPDFMSPKGPATWRKDGRPVYEYYVFIAEGVPEAERENIKWDFGRIIDAVPGDSGMRSLEDLGY